MRDVMNRPELIARLRALDACEEGIAWIKQTPGEPEDLWAACQRGNWMIWFLERLGYDERTMRHIACDFAEGVLPIYERAYPDDPRPRDAIAVARRYADGEATEEEMVAAGAAAWDAARAAEAAADAAADSAIKSAAADAAWAAARAAAVAEAAVKPAAEDAAWAAAWAAVKDAAWAAVKAAAWDAVKAAVWDAAWAAVKARHADMIRARVSWADVERAMERAG